jgi:hypothetical protein
MKRELFAWLKDRKVFTSGGHKTLREYLAEKEEKHLKKIDSRYNRRHKK